MELLTRLAVKAREDLRRLGCEFDPAIRVVVLKRFGNATGLYECTEDVFVELVAVIRDVIEAYPAFIELDQNISYSMPLDRRIGTAGDLYCLGGLDDFTQVVDEIVERRKRLTGKSFDEKTGLIPIRLVGGKDARETGKA